VKQFVITNNQNIMKKLNFLVLFTFIALLLSSCGGLNKMQEMAADVSYTVTPELLEEHGDKVELKIDVKYPAKYFNKNAVLTATPVLVYENGETEYAPRVLQGEKVEANNQVILFATGGSAEYFGVVPFVDDMMKSDLVIRVTASIKEKSVEFEDYKIAEGVIATPKLVMVDPKPVMVGDKFERIIPESYMADIHYLINRAEVRSKELKQEDIEGMKAFLEEANANDRVDLKGIELSAYASPDGALELNDKLAQKREATADQYLEKELKTIKVDKVKEDGFVTKTYTAEDWDGFKKLMEASNIQDKELILRVLSMYSDPVVREKEIKNISKAFEAIAEEILPELRRSKFIVNADKIGYSDDELKALWKSDPDTLNLEEILYTATLFEDLDTKLAVYTKASENFPKCFRAINNVGYVNILKKDADAAEKALEKAKAMKENDIVNNNLGAVALLKGDVEKAEELFTASMGAGAVVNYNLGIINVIKGDYDKAASYFGNTDEYNTALVKYLKKDTEGAMATLNNVKCECALKYYLKAVLAADLDQDELVMESLRTAISKKAELKDRAKVDMEFAKYFENAAFKSIVE
jgi:hypothetical protein